MSSPGASVRMEDRARAKTGITACVRCRQKKKRCDQKLPRCRLCELAGVECYGYEPTVKRQVPRSYVQGLEERVADLESRLREVNRRSQSGWSPTDTTAPLQRSTTLGSHLHSAVSPNGQAGANRNLPLREDGRLHRQRGLGETDIFSVLRQNGGPIGHQIDQSASQIIENLDSDPITLPVREAASSLVNEFFLATNLGMPLLHKPTFLATLSRVYDLGRVIDFTESRNSLESMRDRFFVLEVFAITLLILHKRDPSRIPTWLAERYHKGALAALDTIGLPGDLEGVQALILISQFRYFHPTDFTVWNTIGAALRLAVELRLHQEPASEKLDALSLDTRRRTFWVAYSMERNISMAKTLTSCLSDGAIETAFPSAVDDHLITSEGISTERTQVSGSKLTSFHLFRYRQIQSEMRTVLSERPSPPFQPVDIGQWQHEMHKRIIQWYKDIPLSDKLNSSDAVVIETFKLTYNTGLLYLWSPAPNSPTPNGQQWIAVAQSATKMIQLLRKFFLEKKLTIYWQAVQNLVSAGTSLLQGYTESSELRQCMSLSTLESTLHSCSSVLWGMVERFPAFQSKRDAFDADVSSRLEDLKAGITTGDTTQNLVLTDNLPEGDVSGEWHWSRMASGSLDTEQPEPSAQPLPSSFIDLSGLAVPWDNMVDLGHSVAATPTWV